MNHPRHHSLRSPIVRGLGLAAVLVLVWCAGIARVQAGTCSYAKNRIITYYSNASHTTLVGQCSDGPCPGAGCWGTKTQFASGSTSGFCEICE